MLLASSPSASLLLRKDYKYTPAHVGNSVEVVRVLLELELYWTAAADPRLHKRTVLT